MASLVRMVIMLGTGHWATHWSVLGPPDKGGYTPVFVVEGTVDRETNWEKPTNSKMVICVKTSGHDSRPPGLLFQ